MLYSIKLEQYCPAQNKRKEKHMDENKNLPNLPEENLPGQAEEPSEQPGRKSRVNWNKKYTTIAVYALLGILFAVLCVFFFLNNHEFGKYVGSVLSVFSPIIYGTIFAYLLNKLMVKVETHVFGFLEKPGKRRLQRALSVFLTAIAVVLVICLFLWLLVPQIVAGYADLEGKMKFYIGNVQQWLDGLGENAGEFSGYIASAAKYLNNFINKIYEVIKNILPQIAGAAKNVVLTVKDMLLGFVFAIYFLFAKERLAAQSNKVLRAVASDKVYEGTKKVFSLIDDRFGNFITGKILDLILVGIVCFFGCWIIGVPYYPLISLIIGVCNLVPVFGPIVGIALSSFIVFITSMDVSLMFWYLLFVVLLHILDAHFVTSKLVGEKLGLPAMWIFASLVVMAGFFGLPGMIIAVPTFDVIRELMKEKAESRLSKKDAPTQTSEYYSTEDGVAIYEEGIQATEKSRARDKKFIDKVKSLFKKKDSKKQSGKK